MTPFIKVDSKWLKAASARLPSSAKLIDALYREIKKPDVDIGQVIRLVSMDVAIASRLLRMANSASYTRGETVTSLDQALSWLGGVPSLPGRLYYRISQTLRAESVHLSHLLGAAARQFNRHGGGHGVGLRQGGRRP
jgi:hypothetical protein